MAHDTLLERAFGNPSLADAGNGDQFVSGKPPWGVGPRQKRIPDRWAPVPLSEIQATTTHEEWIWEGYLAVGAVTLLTGLWKAGKTTLLSHLVRAIDEGAASFGGQSVRASDVTIVSEEHGSLWARRRDDLEIGDRVSVICRPFLGRPSLQEWEHFLEYLASRSARGGLVVLDSLPNLWPVADENNASDVIAALAPLHHLTAAGLAVLIVMHPKKGDATEGQATRGSGAIGGFVDVIVELRRYDPARRDDSRRKLTTYSRYEETPDTLVLAGPGEGYESTGSTSDTRRADRVRAMLSLVPDDPPGLTLDEIADRWEDNPPGKRTLRDDLAQASADSTIGRAGAGKKGDPFRYFGRIRFRQGPIPYDGLPETNPSERGSPDPEVVA